METSREIIQRNENAPPTGSRMEREFIKLSSALNGMDQYAEQIAVDFYKWSKNADEKLTESELFNLYKSEKGI